MKRNIEVRVFNEAEFILKNKSTVREMSKYFLVSKSTVHYDLSVRLKRLNLALFKKVDKILKFNLSVRHIRGGEATKSKYKCKKWEFSNKKILLKTVKFYIKIG